MRSRLFSGQTCRIRWVRFIPAVLWMAVIFILSSRSGSELNTLLPLFNRLLPGLEGFDPMHYAAYFVLALAVAFGLGPHSWNWKGCLLNIAICVFYGVTDEWHQSFVPGRSPDLADLWRDAIGSAAASGLVLIYGMMRRKGKPSRNYSA